MAEVSEMPTVAEEAEVDEAAAVPRRLDYGDSPISAGGRRGGGGGGRAAKRPPNILTTTTSGKCHVISGVSVT